MKSAPLPELHLHLLDAELAEDALSSYRRREATWISLVTHGIIIALLLLVPRFTRNQARIVPPREKEETIFLPLPNDQQKLSAPPKTNIISDKDRLAQSRTPSPDKDTLRKLLDARRPGPPKVQQPPPAGQQAMQQNPATAQGAPVPENNQAQLQAQAPAQTEAPQPSPSKKSPFAIASPGTTVSRAIQSVANGNGASGVEYGGGEYGSAVHPKTDRREGMEILSDTMGVDFGPYMRRVHDTVQTHWDPLIPETAMPPVMKKGVVVIEFFIMKDGKISSIKIVSSSGDVALDNAALGALTYANPLPTLPRNFAGDYLQVRARFYYNPDKADFQ